MKREIYILVLLLLGVVGGGYAQDGYYFGGEVVQQAGLSTNRMAQLSQPQLFGTARSMSMANAFTSLGGDLASMAINPAGLGMYRTNEVSITPVITSTNSINSAAAYDSNSKSRFGLANFSVLYKLYEGTGSVVSVNMGIGYNRKADLNYKTSYFMDTPYMGGESAPSILSLMAGQLTVNGLYPNDEGFLGYYGQKAPDLWGAMLAYNAYLINPDSDSGGPYWAANTVGRNASIGHYYDLVSSGSMGEYGFSLGMNINNKLYLGLGLSLETLSQRIDLYYAEDFDYGGEVAVDGKGEELDEQAEYMHYNQMADISGVGFNMKFGVIYRPINSLRLGFAVHTPTFYSVDYTYAAQMASMNLNNEDGKHYPSDITTNGTWTDRNGDAWRLNTPTRVMFGASYTIGNAAIISIDYERDWYNGIRVKNTPFWIPSASDYSASVVKEKFKATNNLRVGAEFKPTERLSLRAGYSYTDSMVADAALVEDSPIAESVTLYTAGIGYRLSPRVSLDAAYQYNSTECSSYRLFYAAYESGAGDVELFDALDRVKTEYVRHNVAITLSVKF